MRRGLFFPPFDDLSDPRVLADLAAEAEAAGFDGVFLWDHVLRPEPERRIADPWVSMAAMAMTTERVRIGALVTPLVRRRVAKLAREIITLDHLSRGRLVVGLGLGVDTGRELSAFGEVVDAGARGDVLDEAVPVLRALVAGERVDHHGSYLTVADVVMHPAAVQRPCPPMWMAARTMNGRPLRRAAATEGLFPIERSPDEVARMLEVIVGERSSMDGFDVAVPSSGEWSLAAWERAGATWWLEDLPVGSTIADVRQRIANA